MKYLHGFKTDIDFHSEYDDDIKYFEPWTSLTHENEEVNYNKKKGEEYLTFEILTSGELYLGEVLFSELQSSLENTIKNEYSNSDDYLFNDKYEHFIDENTIEDNNDDKEGLKKIAKSKSASSIKYKKFLEEFPTLPGIKYKLNDNDWVDWEINSDTYYRTLSVEAGDIVQIKGSKEYLNIFEGNDSWIDPRDIDSSKSVVTKTSYFNNNDRPPEYEIKDFTITINHTDIDFNSNGFGDLNNISSWKENFLSKYDEYPYNSNMEEIGDEREDEIGKQRAPRRNTSTNNLWDVTLENNQFIYSGKIKYHFKNIPFYKIDPVKIGDDILVKGLYMLHSTEYGTYLDDIIRPSFISKYLKKLLEEYNISLNDIISLEQSDDTHIKYFSYDIYNIYSQYNYYGYGYGYDEFYSNKIGLSVFGFLLFDDNNNLIGFSSIPDTLESLSYFYNTSLEINYHFNIFLPTNSLLSTTLDYIEENNFSKSIILEYDLEKYYERQFGGGDIIPPISENLELFSIQNKRMNSINKDFPSVSDDESEVLLIFSHDEEYLDSLVKKYQNENGTDYLLLDRRFNFRGSDSCTFNVRGNVASLYYGDNFRGKITYKTEGIYAGLFYKCDSLISCKNIYLPGYILSSDCYFALFAYCSNLIEVFENFNNNMKFANGAFSGMFFKCTSLTSTVPFPYDENYNSYTELFSAMYYGDSSLSTISSLDIFTDIPIGCFAFTFSNCDSITKLPDLLNFDYINPKGCFCMFSNCDGLEELDDLHFKKVDSFGIAGMFYNCSSLERIGKVEFDAINVNGAEKLFANCSALVEVDSVFANNSNSNDYAYAYMFSDCVSLETPPSLPQEKVSPYLYYKMFYNCISLLSAPELNALNGKSGKIIKNSYFNGLDSNIILTRGSSSNPSLNINHSEYLPTGCYESMFENCTSLNSTITLPALKVYNRAYYKMFKNCTSLRTMPTILAKEIGEKSFGYMFSHCSSLSEVNSIFSNVSLFKKNNIGGSYIEPTS